MNSTVAALYLAGTFAAYIGIMVIAVIAIAVGLGSLRDLINRKPRESEDES